MTSQEMADAILKHIDESGDASFADIMRICGDEAKGHCAMGSDKHNIFLWVGMSETLSTALELLRPAIEPHPTHFLVYLADGQYLNMPLAKQVRKGGYKEPHWTPVVFRRRKEKGKSG